MKLLAALLLAVALPAHGNDIPDWFAETFLDVREDAADAAKEGKRLMLYFWLEGCPYCRQLEEVTFRDRGVAMRMQRELVPVAINVRGDREVTWTDGRRMSEKELSRLLQVRGTPTLLFFDQDARVLERSTGFLPPGRLLGVLDAIPASAPRSASPPGPRAPR